MCRNTETERPGYPRVCVLIFAKKVWSKDFLLTEMAIHNVLLLIMH